MVADPTLLVIDDEEVICRGCQRVLSSQGFHVETTVEAHKGLSLASERDYDAILLDITMPNMDGIEFLERLRKKKPDVPVIVITGHPSIPNAASAVRLRAADYITKPFTPETITQSVQRLVRPRGVASEQTATTNPSVEQWQPQSQGMRFWDQMWLQTVEDGTVRAGALLGRTVGVNVQSVRLTTPGEVVYQGLPLAQLVMVDGSTQTLPAPVSGVVTANNDALTQHPESLMDARAGGNWISCIAPTRLDDELDRCRFRRVVLVNADERSSEDQAARLGAMGCQVSIVKDWDDRAAAQQNLDGCVVALDSASFGDRGPAIIDKIHAVASSVKTVVLAEDSRHENEFRRSGIFYYAVQPFADDEIVDILEGAFRQSANARKPDGSGAECISKICITNRNRTRVCLLSEGGLLQKDHGLGQQVRQALFDRAFPVEVTLGSSSITPVKVLKAAGVHQHVIALVARDTGRLPGSLTQHKGDFLCIAGSDADRVTTFVIQPDVTKPGATGLDERTTAVLAEHIVRFMSAA